ncbi:MAG: selenium cofactor biosynthesis protein YqeC [Dehalococcoidia bacterium]
MPEPLPDAPPADAAPLWRALGLDASGVRPVVAIVGGGGKTSLLYRLGRDAEALGRRAVICGTVRYTRAPHPHATPVLVRDAEGALPARVTEAWAAGARTLVATGVDEETPARLVPVTPATVDALARLEGTDAVLFEADGSRQLPFKAPAPHEPVIPPSTTHVVAVVGLDALGTPVDAAHVHRPERVRAILDRATVDAELVARVLAHPQGGRQHAEGRAFAVVVNKADLDPAAARDLAARIAAEGVARVVVARLAEEGAPVDRVLVDGGTGA